MSGIVGIINERGAPVDQGLLRRMTDSLAFRGPDAQGVWSRGNVGFGHALLRTADESADERQPCSLDGQVWIIADARIDDRSNLVRGLTGHGCDVSLQRPDVELILHAYNTWSERCVEYLSGDFAFAIWDERLRKLFCARDHFGVKPFYYAEVANGLVLSNTLDCVRLHPGVSTHLNDAAIGDFLLFGYNQDSATTTFADIQRLPPAHSLTWTDGRLRLQRYWNLPTDGRIRYKRADEYVERFRELFGIAVADRLRTDRIWMWMSGGLDSTSIAAVAHAHLSKLGKPFDLRACTEVYDTLIPHDERHFAALVAESLGIPIHYQVLDDYSPLQAWSKPGLHGPEPSEIGTDSESDELRRISACGSRVVLCGYGGDPALLGETLPKLFGRERLGDLLIGAARHMVWRRRLPPLGIRGWLRRRAGGARSTPLPDWIHEDFATRLGLEARWQRSSDDPHEIHPLRPNAYGSLDHSFWAYRFESHDPGTTLFPVEVRYPFFDRRLLEYLLAIPALPWCNDKWVLREAMRGNLPELVRTRPKTPMAADPIQAFLQREGGQQLDWPSPSPMLAVYVKMDQVSQLAEERDKLRLWGNIRVLALDFWLRSLDSDTGTMSTETHDAIAT